MKVNVIGKSHLQGVSKRTGNPYDFIQLHYNGPARGVIGQAAMTVSMDPSMVNFESITVPGYYNLDFDNRGYPVELTPISGK